MPGSELLRIATAGSVDDGKSTLIGRLLHDTKSILEDQMDHITETSERRGDGYVNLALLTDGLRAEREQGITIDVAYRYFQTGAAATLDDPAARTLETAFKTGRKFIIADTPGHEQYTRNMVTGASTADLAVILIDARKGILTQTRRHSYLVHLLGIRNLVLAVNKMDLIGYDQAKYDAIVAAYAEFAASIGIESFVPMPISGLAGDTIATRSASMPWYSGPTLIEHLETVPLDIAADQAQPFRMPVQMVKRPDLDFRGVAGLIVSGAVRPGDPVRIVPSGRITSIARIVTFDGDLACAVAGQSVTLVLADDVDCSRGDVVASAASPPESADQFEASLVWMADEPMLPGRSYLLKLATQTVSAQVQAPKYQVNVNTMARLPARTLELNAIGVANLSTDKPLVFEPYADSRALGGFILIDKISNATVAAGLLHFALRRAANVHWQAVEINREAHARLKNQTPKVLWFTGLSGAGKSTIANLVEKKLHAMGLHSFLLDGDNIRHGLNRDLGFTDADRVENIRRVGEVARLMTDAGLIVLTAFISPFRAERRLVRDLMPPGEFVEIHIDTTLTDAERRDVKGLYAKARRGELRNFTGIDSPYEPPERPEIHIDIAVLDAEQSAELIVRTLFG
jgi:bifunctional enzyme CysN/CysC